MDDERVKELNQDLASLVGCIVSKVTFNNTLGLIIEVDGDRQLVVMGASYFAFLTKSEVPKPS